MSSKCQTIDEVVELSFRAFSKPPFKYFGWAIQPIQVIQEITYLLHMIAKRQPKCILEIGTAGGGTLFTLTRAASANATIVSVDLPGGKFGGGYSAWKILLYKSFKINQQKIFLIRRDSHTLSALNAVRRVLGERKLDFLFIDGDHTYEGVKKGFEMYRNLVSKGGIIAFHDIVPGYSDSVGGVPRFWNEIKQIYSSSEIVENWNQGGCGIGVLYM